MTAPSSGLDTNRSVGQDPEPEQEESAAAFRPSPRGGGATPKRINVAVSPEMLTAIENLIEREQVSLTEAVRRLVMYGNYLYRAVKEEGSTLIIRGSGHEKEILLI